MSRFLALCVLNLVTVIWGSQHAIIKDLVSSLAVPSLVNVLRFGVAAVALGAARALLGRVLPRPASWRVLICAGAELALWRSLGFTLQLVGLHWTTASRSAFLLYLNAPIVPLVAWLLVRSAPRHQPSTYHPTTH
jgi:drug/metabolite transporter (DMT)-like permease